ncbi:hypothetical protein [Labrys monachus]|uniref:Uncharacterized protein n=1 Tax=Labrys monachus TaxID=217067 RepID=A0ABU0FCE6_9HYPH|nr:hypothetical protein [Labrys monachus]MDQ0392211.1 hypothetical protein [Labrys monachus]
MLGIRTILAELIGLFVDDGSLALAAAILIGIVALLARLALLPPVFIGAMLAAGCVAILLESVFRAARR